MNIPRNILVACCAFGAFAVPALAGVTINQPANNSDVSAPFTLSASASSCSGQSVNAMGYSFDSSSDTTVINVQIDQSVVDSSTGNHTLHIKAWGNNGASCVEDVAIDVKSGGSGGSGDRAARAIARRFPPTPKRSATSRLSAAGNILMTQGEMARPAGAPPW